MKDYILWFSEIHKDDIARVGGKGANLGELFNLGVPVPPGFCVTAGAYFEFLKEAGLEQKIKNLLSNLDVSNSQKLQKIASDIQKEILACSIPPKIQKAIVSAYQKLSEGKNLKVAVRSSATAEDLPEASFAGQQESYMNVLGKKEVLLAIQKAWASLFGARAIFYREEQGFDHLKVGIAIPIQKMVASEVSGVVFTVDPMSKDKNIISIEAGLGLGDAIVSGSITPDQYQVDKEKLEIISKQVVKQTKMLASSTSTLTSAGENRFNFAPVSKAYQEKQKLSDKLIIQIAILGKKIEQHYKFPQDIEWAVENNKVYIVQTRPVTTLKVEGREWKVGGRDEDGGSSVEGEAAILLLEGIPVSPGIASGVVKILKSTKEISKIREGDILVAEMTNPDFVPAMKKAVAIVTDSGGKTSHAAIVSRELGIPCVVGTELATKTLKTGEVITVDGAKGKVYEGRVESGGLRVEDRDEVGELRVEGKQSDVKTATKVYVNLAEPELAEKIAALNIDGVGLLRAEFMMAQIGEHPRYALEKGHAEQFTQRLYQGLLTFAKAFDPRPVVYRTTDFRTNEYRNLKGGEKYEEEEANPMLGFRGVMRYLADEAVFKMELEAIKRVRRYHRNLWLMLPFVRVPKELIEAKKIMASLDLNRSGTFKLWMMAEVPSSVILLEQFIGIGIDGVSIGSNDLTQLVLGLDRDNPRVANLFDEQNPAVLWALERVVKECQKHGITASICGQAPSIYPELTKKLVEWGISSVSVSPDAVDITRKTIAEAEWELVRGGRF